MRLGGSCYFDPISGRYTATVTEYAHDPQVHRAAVHQRGASVDFLVASG